METAHTATDQQAEWFSHWFNALLENIELVIKGKRDQVALALVCLFSEGHVLLDDVPGTGKTSLAKSIAHSIKGTWSRIQFTPDLLPSDVTGGLVYNQAKGTFDMRRGAVFSNVVLADEINRASPKTQAALLEVMEERQVTVDGRPYRVPRPFLVMATQNPIEMDGTYPLPEAQLDRFLVKTRVGYPDHAAEVRVLVGEHSGAGVDDVRQVSESDEIERLVRAARTIHVAPAVFDYMVRLAGHTRQMPQLRLGASPRGALGLLRTSRVYAALRGRPYVVPGDVQTLAEPVLAHRILMSPSFEASGGTVADAVAEAIASVPAPPTDRHR